MTDPQTWNEYSYVRNNPLALVDPSGLAPQPLDINCGLDATGTYSCIDNVPPPGTGGTGVGGGAGGTGGGVGQPCSLDLSGPEAHALSADFRPCGVPTSGSNGGGASGSCSNLPSGTSPTFCRALQQGLQNALRALRRRKCSNFYAGQGAQTLSQTLFRFVPNAPNAGAWTIPPGPGQSVSTNVFINSNGPFVTFTPTPGQQGPFGRYWGSQGQFQGFILLHELGHQLSEVTGFQPDGGPQNTQLNISQSQQVMNACF
jgi:hypothetical protein